MTDAATEEAFSERNRRRLKLALQAICLVTLVASLVLDVQFIRDALADESEKRTELQRITEEAAAQIDQILKPVSLATTDLAARLTRGEVDAMTVEPALHAMVQSNEAFFGGTVAYRPYGRDASTRLYAPYFTRDAPAGSRQPTQLGDAYDYTVPAAGADALTDWYVRPMREGGQDGWSPPYFDRAVDDHDHPFGALHGRRPDAAEERRRDPRRVDGSAQADHSRPATGAGWLRRADHQRRRLSLPPQRGPGAPAQDADADRAGAARPRPAGPGRGGRGTRQRHHVASQHDDGCTLLAGLCARAQHRLVAADHVRDTATDGPRDLVFHGATDVRVTPIESSTDAANRFVVQRSSFQFKLRTQFDFSRYPLEIERIGIGIGPAERGRSQALVPDLDSYDILLPSQKPGLEAGLQLRGWTIESTAFVLRPRSENSRFGQDSSVDLEHFPELVFEIGLKRVFVDAFISNLTPLIVVAIVLFSLLLLPDSVGIKEILGFCVSLFFVVVFAHLSIRRSISSGQIFDLEYFFLVTYFALLAVPINAFRRTLQVPYPLLEYRGGLVTKVLYWPLTLGIFFLITLLKFH